jgi:hypothetical protein
MSNSAGVPDQSSEKTQVTGCVVQRSSEATAKNITNVAASQCHLKRPALVTLDENVPVKCQKQSRTSRIPTQPPTPLTPLGITVFDQHHDGSGYSYDGEIRSRAQQEAGTQADFSLRLECFEQAPVDVEDWCEAQYILFDERPIFKDADNLADMNYIAQASDNESRIVG